MTALVGFVVRNHVLDARESLVQEDGTGGNLAGQAVHIAAAGTDVEVASSPGVGGVQIASYV